MRRVEIRVIAGLRSETWAPGFVVVGNGLLATLHHLRNSSRRDGSIIAPDGVRRSERNPGKAPSNIPSALEGRIELAQRIIGHSGDRPVTPAFGTAGDVGWTGSPGFHPGLFFVGLPPGSGSRGGLRFVRSQVSEARPGQPSSWMQNEGHLPFKGAHVREQVVPACDSIVEMAVPRRSTVRGRRCCGSAEDARVFGWWRGRSPRPRTRCWRRLCRRGSLQPLLRVLQ